MNHSINIVVLGKSGAGKSSFCNYFFDMPGHFTVGDGKPVTQWAQNFQSFEVEREGFRLRIFDSVGIEPDNMEDWNTRFSGFLDQRNRSPNPGDWVHGFFYVIGASSGRLEPAEIALIRQASSHAAPFQIVLTKCDAAGPEKTEALAAAIAQQFPKLTVHRVCSVSSRKRNGQTSQAYGRSEVLQSYLQQSERFLLRRLGVHTCRRVADLMRKTQVELRSRIAASNLTILNVAEFNVEALFAMPDIDKEMEEFRFFADYLAEFGFNSSEAYALSYRLESTVSSRMDQFGADAVRRFEQLGDQVQNGSFTEKVSAALSMARIAVMLKTTMMNIFDEGFAVVLDEIRRFESELEKDGQDELADVEFF